MFQRAHETFQRIRHKIETKNMPFGVAKGAFCLRSTTICSLLHTAEQGDHRTLDSAIYGAEQIGIATVTAICFNLVYEYMGNFRGV